MHVNKMEELTNVHFGLDVLEREWGEKEGALAGWVG